MFQIRRTVFVLALVGMAETFSSAAGADDGGDRAQARALYARGEDGIRQGRCLDALKDFLEADRIMARVSGMESGPPTTGNGVAFALSCMGRLVEARETALRVSRIHAAPGEPGEFAQARESSRKLASELLGRIPRIVVEVQGPPASQVTVAVDGKSESWSGEQQRIGVDPDRVHVVSVSAPRFTAQTRRIELGEGTEERLQFALREDEGVRLSGWSLLGWGVGAVALGLAAGFAVDLAFVRSTIDRDCPPRTPGGQRECSLLRYDERSAEALFARHNVDLGMLVGAGVVGLLGVGGGFVMHGVSRNPAGSKIDVHPAAGLALVPGGAAVLLGGAF